MNNGETIPGGTIPVMPGFPIQITADTEGNFHQAVWRPVAGNEGRYDIIVDYNGNGRYDGGEEGLTVDATDGQFGDYGFEVRSAPIKILRIPVYYEDINGDTHPVPRGTFVKVSKFYSSYEEWLDTRLRVNEDGQIVFETNLDCELYEDLCSTHRLRVFLESYITAIEPGEGPTAQEVYLGERKDPIDGLPWAHRFASSLFCIENAGGNVWMPVGGKVIIAYDHYHLEAVS